MSLTISIDAAISAKYPDVSIGYAYVENLDALAEAQIPSHIAELPFQAIDKGGVGSRSRRTPATPQGLTLQNLVEYPTVKGWRGVYQDCGVKPKTYKPSVEVLLRRFIKGDYRPIFPAVDLYNYLSAGFCLPMAGYNFDALEDRLVLRYGRDTDRFIPMHGPPLAVATQQIVYADSEEVICWMWNHKDCKRTMLHPNTPKGLFIIDSISPDEQTRLYEALDTLVETIGQLGGRPVESGTLTAADAEKLISMRRE